MIERPIVFMHVPKTGGMSIRSMLRAQFPPERCCEIYDGDTERLRFENKFQLYIGHFNRTDTDTMASQPQIITILREPVSRLLSCYYYWLGFTEHEIERENACGPRLAKMMSMLDFLRSEELIVRQNFDNVQTLQFLPKSYFVDGQLATDDSSAVSEATSFLSSIHSVGLLECIELFVNHLGFTNAVTPRINCNERIPAPLRPRIKDLPRDVIDEINRLTRLDQAVYRAIQRLVETGQGNLNARMRNPADFDS